MQVRSPRGADLYRIPLMVRRPTGRDASPMPEALIREPRRLNPLLRLGVRIADRATGRRMLPARLLAWYPRAAVGAGVLESLVAHDEPSARMLALVRVTASLTTGCPFCVDLNSFGAGEAGVTADELASLQRWVGSADAAPQASLTPRERVAVAYARALSSTPAIVDDDLKHSLTSHFDEREIVILATTTGQVNFWARTLAGLGVPPAGFCPLPAS